MIVSFVVLQIYLKKILSYYFGRIIKTLYICTSSLEITYQERLRERPCEALATVSCGKRNGANSVTIKTVAS
jgi:hypothetical protein